MHHFSLFSARRRSAPLAAALGVLLAATSFSLPQRSAGQDASGPASGDNAPYPNAPYNNAPYGNGPYDNSGGGASGANPPVGVDLEGHADAAATRNGRTTRPRVPAAPANPLVLTDPVRPPAFPGGYGPDGSPFGTQNNGPYVPRAAVPPTVGNPLIPPVVTRQPGNYTVQTNPSVLSSTRYARPLPLFGYDFFQPARQIIIARRRALLPAPRPIRYGPSYGPRPGQAPYGGSRNPGGINGINGGPNAVSSGYAPGGYNAGNGGSTGAFYGTAGQPGGDLNAPYDPSQPYNPGFSALNPYDGSRQGGDADFYGSNGYGPNGYGSNDYGPSGAASYQNGAPGSYSPQSSFDPSASYSQPGDYSQSGDMSGSIPGDVTSQAALRGLPNAGGSDSQNSDSPQNYGSQSYSQQSYGPQEEGSQGYGLPGGYSPAGSPPNAQYPPQPGQYPSQQYPQYPSSYPSQSSVDPYRGGSGFPGDAGPMGSDIQFPGDDALLQSGAANAIAGQVTDPISSTLYRNVLASLPSNYQLQPGDQLMVQYSALALPPRRFTATVDLSGGIEVEGIGRISVAGRTATEAEDTLRQRLSRLYRNVDVSINLRQLRTIQVTVSGDAFAPGTYTIPATATAFNVLNAAGGPTPDGSLRDIRVLRSGRVAGKLDIYPLIGATTASPSAKNGDVALQAGDNIYIPGRLSRIAIRGEVRQPAIYELTPTETLRDALRYAGGVKPSGVDQNVHIDTINNGTDRVIRDVNLRDKTAAAKVSVYDGDMIDVSSIRSIITNRVTVNGAVNQPGDYALTPGMTVSDLVSRARGVLYDTYLDQADLIRLNPDNTTTRQHLSIAGALDGDPAQNIPLKRFDILRLYTRQEVAYIGRRLVTVRGAVQRPGLYTQSDNMHVSDLLLDSGGPLPDAYLNRAVLLHQRGDGTYAYDYVSLRAITDGDKTADLPVLDNDVLAIYRNGEAHFTPDHTVKILGNVVTPGLYARGDGMRLSDLLKQAGAFKPGGGTRVTVAHSRRPVGEGIIQVASSQTVDYTAQQTVASGTDLALQDGDVVAVQGDGNLQDHPAVVTVTGMVNRPGPIIIHQGMRLSDAIKEANGLRPQAFPQGAEFTRMSDALATPGQLDLAAVIARMSDMLNLSQYQRERAKANLALIQAAGSAASGSGSSSLALPGIGGAAAATAANPNLAPLTASLSQNNLVSPGRLLTPSQLQPNGSVAVQLAQALRRPGGIDDVLLKDGDTLVVPETPTTVQVVGAVYSGRGVVYRPGQSIDYYVRLAGGFTPDAATDRLEVIHAGGGLIPADKAGALQPGDLILVPTKVLAEKISRSGGGFSDLFQGLIGSAITLKVLGSVFGF